MGLAAFNRMRRLKGDVAKIEAARFEKWNQDRHEARDHLTMSKVDDFEAQQAAREAEKVAVEKIGEKVREGLGNDDLPMRQEHAAEIAGRTVIDPQGENAPSPVEKVDERLPHNTANEKLVEHMSVNDRGASPELLEAAQKEAGVIPDDERREIEANSDRVKPENVDVPEEQPPMIPLVRDEIAQETAPEEANATSGTLPDRDAVLAERKDMIKDQQKAELKTVSDAKATEPIPLGERDQDPLPENTVPAAGETDTSISADAEADEEENRDTGRSATEDDDTRSKVEIIDAWQHLDWPAKRALAAQLSSDPITNKAQAEKAIQAELDRRAKE